MGVRVEDQSAYGEEEEESYEDEINEQAAGTVYDGSNNEQLVRANPLADHMRDNESAEFLGTQSQDNSYEAANPYYRADNTVADPNVQQLE